MIPGVVANGMAPLHGLRKKIGVFMHIPAYAKESGPGVETVQYVKHFFGNAGGGAIIECEINGISGRITLPNKLRREGLDNTGSLYEIQTSLKFDRLARPRCLNFSELSVVGRIHCFKS